MIQGQAGHVLVVNPDGSINVVISSGEGGASAEARSASFIDINNSSFTTLATLTIPVDKTFHLKEICITLQGFSAQFVVEYFDGTTTTTLRYYILNTQQSTFTELLGNSLPLPYVGVGSSVTIKALMLGVNQDGKAFGVINGTMI